ncbi:HalOD1 output domain-containing protein [Haloferax sp. DFSO60]|uniref:HalOD1 output domain-containing protein n=1 Tax=Haloferax sp. DFSO60 TaxID=3388652 RepID=UPI00397881DB
MTPTLSPRHDANSLPSFRVVQAVAREESVHETDLTTPLADVIDPEALDTLVEGDDGFSSLTFCYYGYEVTVDESGHVSALSLKQ